MFLGRNTQQWLGLIAALNGMLMIVVPVIVPTIDVAQLGVVLGAVGIFLGALVTFVANTYTTPANDPQLVQGTMIRVTDKLGRLIDHQKLEVAPDPIPAALKTTRGRIPATHSDNPPPQK